MKKTMIATAILSGAALALPVLAQTGTTTSSDDVMSEATDQSASEAMLDLDSSVDATVDTDLDDTDTMETTTTSVDSADDTIPTGLPATGGGGLAK